MNKTIIVAGILGFVLAGCSGSEAKYQERATRYIQEENWPKARVALRNALKINPDNAESYFLIGQVEEREKNWRGAFGDYLKAVELDPAHRDARLKLGRLYLAGGEGEKAGEMADHVLAAAPGHAEAEILKVAALARSGHLEDATAQAVAVHAAHPEAPEAAGLLAALHAKQGRYDEAERVFRRGLETSPTDVGLLNGLGQLLLRRDRRADAEQVFRRMVEAEPAVFEHRVKVALAAPTPRDGEAVLREGVRLDPKDEVRRLALAEYLATRSQDPAGAEAVLLEAKKDLPRSMKIRFVLGAFYEATGRPAKARAVYEDVAREKADRPQGLDARAKLAALDAAEGHTDRATRQVEEILDENPRASQALMLRARLALARGEAASAVQDVRNVLRDQPESVDAHLLLGQAYLASGDAALARESFEKAAAVNPRAPEARRALIRLDAVEGRADAARARLDDLVRDAPRDLPALQMLLEAQIEGREWSRTSGTIDALRRAGAGAYAAAMAQGRVAQARAQWNEALAAYRQAGDLAPDALDPLLAVTRIEVGRSRLKEAAQRLVDLIRTRPDHPYAHGILGSVLLAQRDQAGAEGALREAIRIKPNWPAPWVDLATLKLAQKDPAAAVTALEAGLDVHGESEAFRLLLATALSDTGRPDRAMAEYETILKRHPRSLVAANNLAALLADQPGDAQGLARALALTREFETTAPNPLFLDTLGWVYVRLGQTSDGLRLLKQVIAKGPDHPSVNYHLGAAYRQAGETDLARIHLEKALKTAQPFAGRDEAAAMLAAITKR